LAETDGSQGGGISLFLGNGDGTFQNPTEISLENQPGGCFCSVFGLVAGDFNGDGQLDLVTSNPDNSFTNLVTLLQGNLPALAALPSTLNWGSIQVGSFVPDSFSLLNTGNTTFDLSNIGVTGANAGDFSVGSNNCATLAASKSCTVNLSFSPSQTGTRNAAVNVMGNTAPLAVPVTGTGTSSSAALSPPTLSFPSQFVDTSGLPQNAQLTNNSKTTVTIASVTASPADFAALSTCGDSLAPNASCSIGVFFDPTVGGTRNGTLTVVDSASNSPQVISLSGLGQDFSMASSGSTTATVRREELRSTRLR